MPKRKTVTAVACSACKHRKSKCDGQRPICTSCIKRGQSDCEYDINSDQRRTTALKEKIDELKREADDLKAVLLSACTNEDQTTMSIVRQLVASNYRNLHETAQVLREKAGAMQELASAAEQQQSLNFPTGVATAMSQQTYMPGFPALAMDQYGGDIQRSPTTSSLSASTLSTETDHLGGWGYKMNPQAQAWSM